MAITLDGTNGINSSGVIVAPDGSASAPAITNDGDTNTGIFFPAADTIAFAEGGAEAMRIDSSGNVGIGVTPSAWANTFKVIEGGGSPYSSYVAFQNNDDSVWLGMNNYFDGSNFKYVNTAPAAYFRILDNTFRWHSAGSGTAGDNITFTERMRIDSSGNLLLGKTALALETAGIELYGTGEGAFTRSAAPCLYVNRLADDGDLVRFFQATTLEGTISVSGSTVSYNGGHLSRWAQMLTKPDLLKGTVMSNLDEMNVYIAPTTYWTEEDELPVDEEGNPTVAVGDVKVETHEVQNEQLNKVKVSDVEGDANVAGVFVNWTYDEAHQVDEINMAMTGDMIIRIAEGVTVARGDLLMSAGDGTAKPQGDDIVRSKTIAKVTSTHVTCTYDDGSYCVPCVLMAC
jgi:hypothetical protein